MGIRFYCPNGHKLNVKSFQAGLKGICPHCGAKFQIPQESTRKSSKDAAGEEQTVAVEDAPADTAGITAMAEPGQAEATSSPVLAQQTSTAAVAPEPQTPLPSIDPSASGPHGDTAAPVAPPESTPSVPVAEIRGTGSADMPDPLAGADETVWYVRPSSGGQFGPAGNPVMKTWLTEGRISGDSLVWREGWRDWQSATEVFPQLAGTEIGGQGPAPQPGGPAADVSPTQSVTADKATIGRGPRTRPRKQSVATQAAIIILLIFAVLILAILFAYVLFREPEVNTERWDDRPVMVEKGGGWGKTQWCPRNLGPGAPLRSAPATHKQATPLQWTVDPRASIHLPNAETG